MMDEAREKAGTNIFVEVRGVDVEAILERVYGIIPDFVDLPDGILGKTLYHRDNRVEVQISRALAEEAELSTVARRRLRTTTAHECAHVIEHGALHLADTMTLSFLPEPAREEPRVLCRGETINSPGYSGEWWEYQANRGMASLLLPRGETMRYLTGLLTERQCRTMAEAFAQQKGEAVARELSRIFDVSLQAVVYRLQELGSIPKNVAQEAFHLGE
jgi:hypothetical protein